jgi:predicted 3-demethylubiquinone-9 3-methyltransferase (glyoxalase superfamily)
MPTVSRITPCLWFDSQAEEAARFYTSIFPNSRITAMSRYGEAGREVHGQAAGTVLNVAFELDGQPFTALNGGPVFTFSEAISFQVNCDTQDEIDYFWERLGERSEEGGGQCGWLKDKYGASWQVVPRIMPELMTGDQASSDRVMMALLKMKKLNIADLLRAHAG